MLTSVLHVAAPVRRSGDTTHVTGKLVHLHHGDHCGFGGETEQQTRFFLALFRRCEFSVLGGVLGLRP
ncbi:hypothetical protein AB0K74_24335 [Streptomyces sp. NPDC056159]|uniref:hypothetical protein n=1 Tax=unclassified Streptomyces TaxID=2593676 RepID=UPI003435C6D0